jgi:hypothetical protein
MLTALMVPISQGTAQAASHHWRWKTEKRSLDDISCPTTKLCVGIINNDIYSTTDVLTKHLHWKKVTLEPASQPSVQGEVALDAISCASAHFCAVVDDIGNVFTTTHPTGSKSAWTGESVDSIELNEISCASSHLCAAVDYYGRTLVSGTPVAANTWHISGVPSGANGSGLPGVSCVGTALCVTALDAGVLEVATHPASATPSFQAVKLHGADWEGVSCPSVHRCVAVGSFTGTARLAVSTHPTSAKASAWKVFKVGKDTGYDNVSCASSSFCMVTGAENLYSSKIAASAHDWHLTKQPQATSQVAISCPSTKECLAPDSIGDLYLGRR